jgi:hypothetical protein
MNNKLYYILKGGSPNILNVDTKCLNASDKISSFNKDYLIIGIIVLFFIFIIVASAYILHMEYQCNCKNKK